MMNKFWWQSYDKKSLSDKNQVPLWIKRMISLWTAMEINLAMFPVYKWQSNKLVIDDTTAAPALYIVGQ